MAANKFKFGEDLISYQNKWELHDPDNLKKIKITGDMTFNFAFENSSDSEGYIAFDGFIKPEQLKVLKAFSPSAHEVDLNLTLPDTFQFMSMDFRSPKGKITIVLPSGTKLEEIELSTFSDNIQVSGASSKMLSILAKSGNIDLSGIQADHLLAETYSGHIHGSDIQASSRLINRSGDVVIKDMEGPMDIEVNSGDVNVEQLDVSSVNIVSRSGNVKVQPAPTFRGFYDLKAWSGSITAPEPLEQTTDTIRVETYSGNIHIIQDAVDKQ